MSLTQRNERKVTQSLSAKVFSQKFLRLILFTWIVPAIFGMGFLLYINMFTFEQFLLIQTKPLEPLFVIISVAFAYWYFRRFTQPITNYLQAPGDHDPELALQCMRRFPLHYWGLFLLYLVMAASVVIRIGRKRSRHAS